MPLEVELIPEPDDSLTLVLTGELDVAQAEELTDLLDRALRRCPRLTLDLAKVTFLDCAILGVLVRSRRSAREADGQLRISTCRPAVRRLFALTHLEETFDLPHRRAHAPASCPAERGGGCC